MDSARRRRRADFEDSSVFEYPQHLRQAIEDAPTGAGVYTFHGQEGDLPLYIGKSINIRARLLSHLRTADEARMLRQTQRISHIRTAGEIGALLLEAQMIKAQHPLFNQKLRRNQQLCSLQMVGGVPQVVYARDIDFATQPDLHGLFASRHAALDALRAIADQHKLCYGPLGLEKLSPGKACFRAAIRQCAGVCRGDESPEVHRERLFSSLLALRVACWPFGGAVGLVERDADLVQIHVVNHWCYLGSAATVEEARRLSTVAAGFDADGYKILCRPLLTQSVQVQAL
ncbi:MAG: excinuclease Cho [Limnohabitans sp.]|jgi:excinuclease Cho|uniref:excinuclease Cho n=1 Tax=Limnohabitans sp. TaxID=1907725 RepID=UPI001B44640D|nr:excinuclease Cho [Limnohabitans sp.]MBP6220048.1 excinuclease Cho [Limnohabitans sp.]MBP6246274.1 excinuclease Cho [Limnohabitans sp.]